MNFVSIMNNIIAYYQAHTALAIISTLVLLYLLIRKTKLFFTLLFIALVVAGVFYVISYVSSVGVQQKSILIQRDMP